MDKKYLVVNTGSASKKYALYSGEVELFKVHFEREGGGFVATLKIGVAEEKMTVSPADYDNSIDFVLGLLKSKELVANKNEIAAVGVRIVAPGAYFLANKILDQEFLDKLERAREEAPLHINPVIAEIGHLKKALPETAVFGVSDSAFHATMPEHSRRYSLPEKEASKFGIYRYGYHGISMRSVLSKIEKTPGSTPSKVIICHLGGGSTITAVKDGKSIDTSMGFTPLEGLPMGTRIGNIDAGAVIYLAQKLEMSLNELEDYLNSKCGLLGLSGKTPDVRELIELEKNGDKEAALALEAFAYNVKKYIGAYFAALGGLDLLVFTATIGERSFIMRSRICDGLQSLGMILDPDKNNKTVSTDGFIHGDKSPVKIAVIVTDEMKEIAKEISAMVF